MNTHLTDEELAAVVAGSEIDDERQEHLDGCVLCRAEAARFAELVEARRDAMRVEEPDWQTQTTAIMSRIAGESGPEAIRRRRWMRPLLAAAAVLVLAIGVGVMLPGGGGAGPANDDIAVEEILAEMDELLADESIPGFEVIDPWLESQMSVMEDPEPTPSESVG